MSAAPRTEAAQTAEHTDGRPRTMGEKLVMRSHGGPAQVWYIGQALTAFRVTKWRWERGYYVHRCSRYGTMCLDAEWVWESALMKAAL